MTPTEVTRLVVAIDRSDLSDADAQQERDMLARRVLSLVAQNHPDAAALADAAMGADNTGLVRTTAFDWIEA